MRGALISLKSGTTLTSGAVAPVRVFGTVTKTADGSVGQTYSAPAGMTGWQWYREALTSDQTKTLIAGATASTYVTQAADGPQTAYPYAPRYRMVVRGMVNGVPTDAVAIAVVSRPPDLLEGFNDYTVFTTAQGASLANDTARKVQGASSLALTSDGTQQGTATRADIGARDPATMGTIVYFVDAGDDPEMMQCSPAALRIGQSNSYTAIMDDLAGGGGTDDYKSNGYWVGLHVSENATLSGLSPSLPMGVRVYGSQSNSPFNSTIRYDALMCNAGGFPTTTIGFDDGRPGQYDIAAPMLESYGWRGTFYIPIDLLGQASRLTEAQVLDLYARGHDIQLDADPLDRIVSSTYADVDAWGVELQRCIDWFTARGIPRPRFVSWTNGYYRGPNTAGTVNVGGTRIFLSGSTLTNAAQQIGVTSSAGIVVGMKVIGDGLPKVAPFARVQSIDDATHVTLTIAPTKSATRGLTFTNDSAPFHTDKMPQKLRDLGFWGARSTFVDADYFGSRVTRFGAAKSEMVHSGIGVTGLTGVQMAQRCGQNDLRGGTQEFYVHDVYAGGNLDGTSANTSINCAENNLRWLLDDRKAKENAGLGCVLPRLPQWLRDGNSSIPV
jgi:Predicted xylanase/chitin deacetylase